MSARCDVSFDKVTDDHTKSTTRYAQAGLRGLIEQAHGVPFIMTANDISKLHPALRSRCMTD